MKYNDMCQLKSKSWVANYIFNDYSDRSPQLQNLCRKKVKNTKDVTISRKSKNRQYNDKKKTLSDKLYA